MEGLHGSVYHQQPSYGNGAAPTAAAVVMVTGSHAGETAAEVQTSPGRAPHGTVPEAWNEGREAMTFTPRFGGGGRVGDVCGGGVGELSVSDGGLGCGVDGGGPAPPTPTPEIDDLAPMLLERLEEKKAEKHAAQVKIQRLTAQLQKLQSSAATKHRGRRETPQQIDVRIAQMERRRTTTSLSLGEEKKLMREIGVYERLKRLELDIVRVRGELNQTRDWLRENNSAIAELEGALSRIELANRLGCRTAQLRERYLPCPVDRISRVVGKNGAMIARIEKTTGVQIEIEHREMRGNAGAAGAAAVVAVAAAGVGGERRIRLVGNEVALDAAEEEILNITLAVEEQFEISKILSTYLLHKRGAALSVIRETHPTVNVDLTGRTLQLRGRPERVSAARDGVLGLDVRSAVVPVKSSRQIGVILGKGGSNVQRVQEQHGVTVDVVDNAGKGGSDDDSVRLEIVGLSSDVHSARAVLEDIVFENEYVEESINVSSDVRNMFLDNAGAVLREIQNDMGGFGRLSFDKRPSSPATEEEQQKKLRVPSTLTVTTRRCDMAKWMELVRERIDAYEATVISVDIDPQMIPYIIGKGGTVIRSLQDEGSGGTSINVFKETSSITIRSENDETRQRIKKKIEDIVAMNQTRMIPIEKRIIGALFGEAGKEVKKKIVDEIGAVMVLSSDDRHVVVKGTTEQIDEAARRIKDFLDMNFTVEMPVDSDDEQFLFQGGLENCALSKIQAKHSVSASVIRSKQILSIRGREADVLSAMEDYDASLRGGNGHVVHRMDIPAASRGIILGKEGSQLKQLEADYEGVTVTLLRSADVLVLRGQEEQVRKCRSRVNIRLATAISTEHISLDLEELEAVTKGGIIREVADDYGAQINLEGSTLKIRGVPPDVADAKARIMEVATGKYVASMPLEKLQVHKLKKAFEISDSSQQHFQQIGESTKAKVFLDDEEECIKLEGKRSNVKKAKFLLLKYLDFLLPEQFAKVTLPKQSVRTVGSAATLASLSADSGAYLFLDRDLSCVHIRSFDPSQVVAATALLKSKLDEADSKCCTIQLEKHESWLIAKVIGKGGSTINEIQKESGSVINCSRQDLSLTISGENKGDICKAKEAIMAIIESGRKECRFVAIPEFAMTSFIGKGGLNVKNFEAEHEVSVHVDRVGGSETHKNGVTSSSSAPRGIRIQTMNEDVLLRAVEAAEAWVSTWEENNAVTTVRVESAAIASAIVGKKGSVITALQQETECRINVDRDTRVITISGKKSDREDAERRINEIVEAETEKIQARMIAVERERDVSRRAGGAKSVSAASEGVASKTTPEEKNNVSTEDGSKQSQKANYPTIPVGVSPSDYTNLYANQRGRGGGRVVGRGVGRGKGVDGGKETVSIDDIHQLNPHVTDAGKLLLKFLSSNDSHANAEILSALSLSSTSEDSATVDRVPLTQPEEQTPGKWDTLSAVTSSSASSDTSVGDEVVATEVVDLSSDDTGKGNFSSIPHQHKGYYRSSGGFLVRL